MNNAITYVGLDAHKESIVAATLLPQTRTPIIEKLSKDEATVRRFVRRLKKRCCGEIRACYEAGPTGFALQRLLERLGVPCQVIAPSLIRRTPQGARRAPDSRVSCGLFRGSGLLLRACTTGLIFGGPSLRPR